MKTKNVMMASFATLLMAGCSQNEVTEINPDSHPQIGFGVYTGTSVRGVDMTTASMKDDPDTDKYGGFGIMGYYTGQDKFEDVKTTVTPSFMHNQKVKWDATSGSGVWTYDPVKYWPNTPNDKISFFAYAPYEPIYNKGTKTGVITSSATEKGIPTITFTLKGENELNKMVDLVVADQRDMEYSAANGGKINFNFAHTLSRVSFKAQLNDGDFTGMDGKNNFVYITHMWIVGTDKTKGNLSLINQGTSNINSKFYTKAKWSNLHWNYEDAIIPEKDFSLDNMLNFDTGITESNPIDGHSGTVKGVKITNDSQGTNNAVALFPSNQYLYLIPINDTIPDTSKSGCEKDDIWIGFHYDIVSMDTSSSPDAPKYVANHAESVIKLPVGHMKRNESYLYTLKINLHEIKIENAEVSKWTETPNDVDIE